MQTHNKPLGSSESEEVQTQAGRTCKGASIGKLDRAPEELQAAALRMHEAKPGRVSKTQY
ncbi:hypothetical protein N7508_005369 [Penicillium antarcticum]|uniref:uncharacterized protein n=1 Tax=Penicillium antarcticum TaxID=416450 RepID=UPI0023A1B68C|nr:uncharacterized protein N7508_005369 [Penicillium antarcticum]KAJ5306354.1 hypothetical protein N7508_005369 [Penicillium antarcticum]